MTAKRIMAAVGLLFFLALAVAGAVYVFHPDPGCGIEPGPRASP